MRIKQEIESVLKKIIEPKTDFEKRAEEVGIQAALGELSKRKEDKPEENKK